MLYLHAEINHPLWCFFFFFLLNTTLFGEMLFFSFPHSKTYRITEHSNPTKEKDVIYIKEKHQAGGWTSKKNNGMQKNRKTVLQVSAEDCDVSAVFPSSKGVLFDLSVAVASSSLSSSNLSTL